MVEWVKGRLGMGSIIFSAYKMGKAQEALFSIFNEGGIRPIVSEKVGKHKQDIPAQRRRPQVQHSIGKQGERGELRWHNRE